MNIIYDFFTHDNYNDILIEVRVEQKHISVIMNTHICIMWYHLYNFSSD